MSNIKCNVIACSFNHNSSCLKKEITVEGLYSKSTIGTFCLNFKKSNFKIILDNVKEAQISCNSNYCKYNKDDKCTKKDVIIDGSNAEYRSETKCSSFSL